MSIAIAESHEVGKAFPPHPEVEHEESELNIPLLQDGEVKEVLKMTSLLKMDRGIPTTNSAGYRQFEFKILDWEAAGYSELLSAWVTFTLSDAPQPHSVCIAQTTAADYPAMMIYNAIFDVYVGATAVDAPVTGLGIGMDVMATPPRNHVHFQKAFRLGEDIQVINATCSAMMSIEKDYWEKKATEFRALRGLA